MTATLSRQRRGKTNYLNGLSAEDSVAKEYLKQGGTIEERRWRGAAGEIDLIIRQDAELVFTEVKRAEDFARASERLSDRQMQRIYRAASEYVANEPDGLLTLMRIDVALVNAKGETKILQNVSI